MAGFYSARRSIMPPLPWTTFAPPLSDAGPYLVLDRLLTGRWRLQDISEVIKWGLIGAGMDQQAAIKLVAAEVEGRRPLENLVIAQRVLGAGVVGSPEEDVGKKSGAANQAKRKPRSLTGK